MSIVFEDIGVRLPYKGSSTVINAIAVEKSKDLKTHKNWVSVEPVSFPKPMPIWPLIKPTSPQIEVEQPSKPPSSELNEVRQSLRKIEQSTKAMLDLLASRSLSPEVIQTSPSHLKDFPEVSQLSDPMFIPKTMMPKDAEISIHTKKGEVSVDLDAVTDALRRARKR
jgi:pyruvate carboxylase